MLLSSSSSSTTFHPTHTLWSFAVGASIRLPSIYQHKIAMGNEHMIRDLFIGPENTRESFQDEYEREHSRRHPRQAGVSPQVTMGNKDKVRDRFTSPQKIEGSIQDELDRQRSRRKLSQARASPQVIMGNKDKVRDRFTSPQKIEGSIQDELDRQRSRRQLGQAGVNSKKQIVGHIPRVAPSEQDLDIGSASQAEQKTQNTTAVSGVQRAGKKGENSPGQPPSQTPASFQIVPQRVLSGRPVNPSGSNESSLRPNVLDGLAKKYEQDRESAHDQESACGCQARADRSIAVAQHNVVIDYYTCPPNIRDIRNHPHPTSLNSQCGTVLANEDDYFVREEGLQDDGEWDRCISPPRVRDVRIHTRPTSLNSQCGTVLANEDDYLVREEGLHDDGEWDCCEMSSGEED